MRVLYLPYPPSVEPRYSDFVNALDVEVDVGLVENPASFEAEVADATVVVEDGGLVANPEMIRAGASAGIQLWQVTTTGVDHVDVALFHQLGVPLAHVPGRFTAPAVAEHALFLMLALARRFAFAVQNLQAGVFYEPSGTEIAGKTVGIIGFGATGRELAVRCLALGMQVVAVEADPQQAAEGAEATGVRPNALTWLPRLLAESDFVSIHVPLQDSTRNLIGVPELESMKPSAYLINTARGEVVNEAALHTALASGTIAGAGLDVFSAEPIDRSDPLLQLDNVIATPHVAGITRESSRRHGEVAAENVGRIHAGQPPLHLVGS